MAHSQHETEHTIDQVEGNGHAKAQAARKYARAEPRRVNPTVITKFIATLTL